ncbi:MAG: cytochrome c oxidase accessory protein CcoG [Helicobacteraceae bacterium]|nr:cytochrome c oxidase accessory protein CcoG [Helicobacteraceae bacterium]
MSTKPLDKKTPWRYNRYVAYAVITAVALILPWIVVDGNHFFLLSFDKLKLELAFVSFDMQEMYLMPFLLMIMFLGIFGITVFGGRMFCGWMCPQTIFRVIYRDLIETKLLGLRKRITNKQKEPDYSIPGNKLKRVVAILIWTFLAFVAASDLMWFFVPPEDFLLYLQNPAEHTILFGTVFFIVLFLVYDIIFLKEDYCVYVCPYSRIQSVLYDEDTIMAIYDPHRGGKIYNEDKDKVLTNQKEILAANENNECTSCESCVTICPTHIDIRNGLQLECINCLECVDACTKVMGKLGKPSLVKWSSDRETVHLNGKTRYMRPKIIGYLSIILILIGITIWMGGKKEHMLLNINKETRLYSIKHSDDNIRVKNAYTFLLQNTLDEEHRYYFDVITAPEYEGKIKISRPTKAFLAKPDIKKKTVVVLYTDDLLVKNTQDDTIIPITIRAYAIDDKVNIVVDREATFTFPRHDILIKDAK